MDTVGFLFLAICKINQEKYEGLRKTSPGFLFAKGI
jgi:hypothetical protein